MIVKNVAPFIENCLRSVLPYVDEAVIVDTGSTDDTKAVIWRLAGELGRAVRVVDCTPETHPEAFLLDVSETWGDVLPGPFTGKYMLANFGMARQVGWDLLSTDYGLWLDSDDVLEHGPNLPAIAAEMAANGIDAALVNYDYASDGQGHVVCKLQRERILKVKGPKWEQPVHEVMCPITNGRPFAESLLNVKHMRDKYRAPAMQQLRNLKILVKWFESHPIDDEKTDPRMIFYLGMEERFVWPQKAVESFKLYCKRSGWDEERGVAHQLTGFILENSNQLNDALAEYALAALEFRWNPDPFFGAARVAYFKKDWVKCAEWTESGFRVLEHERERTSVLHHDPLDRTYRPYVYYGAALLSLGRVEEAKKACEAGLKMNPGDPHLKGNLETCQKILEDLKKGTSVSQNLKFRRSEPLDAPPQTIASDVLMHMAVQLWKRLIDQGDWRKALTYLESLPASVASDPKVLEALNVTKQHLSGETTIVTSPTPPEEPARIESLGAKRLLKIAIWTGPAWEPWTPENLKTGIGGSETAAICMARELAKLGHQVQVLGDCKEKEGWYDGVQYLHHIDPWTMPDSIDPDILIVSRQVAMLSHFNKAKTKILWVHDIHVGHDSPEIRSHLEKADAILTLSHWHKKTVMETYPYLDEKKVVVTRNGIDVERFEREVPKKNHLIYSSSPDRGLMRLLDLFPLIRKEVPDAELHVYYGFATWEAMAKAKGNQSELDRIASYRNKISGFPGGEFVLSGKAVVFHGRVGQDELAEAFLRAKVWGYPTWFSETSCITAMEAQAAGCVPVTTAYAALTETIQHGFLIRGPETAEEYSRTFVSTVVRLMQDDDFRKGYALPGREQSMRTLGWSNLALRWEKSMTALLEAKQRELKPGRVLHPLITTPTTSAHEKEEPLLYETKGGNLKPSDLPTVKTPRVSSAPAEISVPIWRQVAPSTTAPLRGAIILGRLGAAVHGVLDIDRIFSALNQNFVTGTVSGFVNLCWGLAERGHVIDAFADIKRDLVGSKYGGANFYQLDANQISDDYDFYISINEPDVLRPFRKNRGKKICVTWLNDFSFCRPGFDDFVDTYVCPSKTHLSYLASTTDVSRSKMIAIPLSANPEFYDGAVSRRPFSMAYCSSPDRGLHTLLEIFPSVRTRVPEANLRIYYRFAPWLDIMLNDPGQNGSEVKRRAVVIKEFFDKNGMNGENGVTLVGPLPPIELISELKQTRVLSYPCNPMRFTEGFSTAILDACLAGCVPVIAGVDALPEVYETGPHIIYGNPDERKTEWVNVLVAALTDDDFARDVRVASRMRGMEMTRQKVSERWEKLLQEGK